MIIVVLNSSKESCKAKVYHLLIALQ